MWVLESGIFWIISRGFIVRILIYFGNIVIIYGGLFFITKDGKYGFLYLYVYVLLKYIRLSVDVMVNFIIILLKRGMILFFKLN